MARKTIKQHPIETKRGFRLRVWDAKGTELTAGRQVYIQRPLRHFDESNTDELVPDWGLLVSRYFPKAFGEQLGKRVLLGRFVIDQNDEAELIYD